ncbi:MAG: hypothetical protein PHF18_01165 [Methanosarcina sp.]|uniref:hypothetical protein n=1 Tax=Methanosarcina sp. TaxID=2213 RepID=UPI002612E8E0|nr:hypothetical protein [Methanosarcina sp.]MDD3245476.1 hypothetical protein [Methanosarcina sp.]MDD4249748.1 hypothetical protein [Methanosarcina sp.]
MTAYIGWLQISNNSYSLKKHFLLKNIVATFGFFSVILFGPLLSDTDVEALVLYFAAITTCLYAGVVFLDPLPFFVNLHPGI